MPTPRKHETPAARQAAYRARQAEARRQAAAAKPPRPMPTVPGPARWRRLIAGAVETLETARDEMQAYYDERSEAWQEGERGEAMQARIDALEEALSALAEVE